MTTYSDLIEEIVSDLNGYAMKNDTSTVITTDISPTDLTIPVESASEVASRGTMEIDQELIYATGFDDVAGVVKVGRRGFGGSSPVAHTTGALLTVAPSWPKFTVAREINNAIAGVYPFIYGVKVAPQVIVAGYNYQYPLPADAVRVVDVRYWQNSIDGWNRVKGWEQEMSAPSADFPTGAYVNVFDGIVPGSKLQIIYATRPGKLTALTDDYAAVTGLAEQTKDLIVLSVTARMTKFLDAARLPSVTTSAQDIVPNKQIGSGGQVSNQLYQTYLYRLQAERSALDTLYPPRIHRTR